MFYILDIWAYNIDIYVLNKLYLIYFNLSIHHVAISEMALD